MRLGTVTIERRFCGPSDSGNGGYTCGALAAFVDAPDVEVTLRGRPPLERELVVESGDGRALLFADGELVAEAAPGSLDATPPAAVSSNEATEAATRYAGFTDHVFPECFVCGPDRDAGDGLRIFPGPVAGRSDTVAAPWVAHEVSEPVIWAAIDCPGAFACGMSGRGEVVLGRMVAQLTRLPAESEPCIAVGWRIGADGRKLFAGTALFDAAGAVLAAARQTWIVPRGIVASAEA
jgi:hypothetical protein